MIGIRSTRKAILLSMLTPHSELAKLQKDPVVSRRAFLRKLIGFRRRRSTKRRSLLSGPSFLHLGSVAGAFPENQFRWEGLFLWASLCFL
ncbi:MAG: hypothetical protein EBT30_09055 [Verrucomicrobia bacterium]|nr:hypothetical protein [Verrucomicrobiota bacterium]